MKQELLDILAKREYQLTVDVSPNGEVILLRVYGQNGAGCLFNAVGETFEAAVEHLIKAYHSR